MNFASWSFVLAFLPATVLAFYALRGSAAQRLRPVLIIVASMIFYAWAGWHNALVMACSIVVNLCAGKVLAESARLSSRARKALMWAAVAFNLAILSAFKIEALHAGQSEGFRSAEAILIPLALSYVTFQQIGFIVSCWRQIKRVTVLDYLFFIAFFPHLVLGPILRFQDMAAQLKEGRLARAASSDIGVGLSIFVFGLAQKVLLADQLAPAVDTVFLAAQSGPVSAAETWFALIGFQLQLYFDFAGYADMAIGLGRMFGIRMPINFDRPLFSVDRFDNWRRWHITFAVFMRTHVFRPLVRRAGVPIPAALAATGILSGLWHGLGWTFVVWGLVQTAILLFAHEMRRRARKHEPPSGLFRALPVAMTFLTSAAIGGLFRAPTLESAGNIYGGVIGLGGLTGDADLIGPRGLLFLPLCAIAAWGLPNSAQFFRRYWDVLDPRSSPPQTPLHPLRPVLEFSLSRGWALVIALVLAVCLALIGDARRFVYAQF